MSQDSDLSVLLNCMYQSIWLIIILAQWLSNRACKAQIKSSNPDGAFVHINFRMFYPKLHFFSPT